MPWLARAAVVVAVLSTACGGSAPASQAATPATVAAQPSDLPAGMVRCDLTGDIDSFIRAEATPDPATSKTMSADWATAKGKGAQAGYVAVFTDSADHCKTVKSSATEIGAGSYELVLNFVVQFKDEKTAAAAYTDGSILGFTAAELRQQGAVEGTKTGLSSNSVVVDTTIANQRYYFALWQAKSFGVFLAVLNVDPEAARKVAMAENSRIK
jgi:hypothetical protein